jgi:hypothetical protein
MTDFETALQARLERNAELRQQRDEAELEFERFQQQQREEAERREQQLREARHARHGELVDRFAAVAGQLKEADPEGFVVRLGWTETRQEFIAKLSTRLMEPARSLLVELDRDDDEVLVRWHSDVGNALGLWRLLEVDAGMLEELILQLADQDLWRGRSSPPPFPKLSE